MSQFVQTYMNTNVIASKLLPNICRSSIGGTEDSYPYGFSLNGEHKTHSTFNVTLRNSIIKFALPYRNCVLKILLFERVNRNPYI